MDAYLDYVRASLASFQANPAQCRGCGDVRNEDKPLPEPSRESLRFKHVNINQHRNYCNCKCVYCPFWNKKPEAKLYSIKPALLSLLEQNALAPSCVFGWGGGESTILPEFEEVCFWLQEQGYRQYVHTNAIRPSDAIVSMLAANKGVVNISLDSWDQNSYQEVKGVDAWNEVINNLRRYRAACADPMKIELKYIIFGATNSPRAIDTFLQLCQDLDIRNIQYSLHGDEVMADTVASKTIIGTVFFQNRAKALGLSCKPVGLPQKSMDMISAMSDQL